MKLLSHLFACTCILTAERLPAPTAPASHTFLPFVRECGRPVPDALLLPSSCSAHQRLPLSVVHPAGHEHGVSRIKETRRDGRCSLLSALSGEQMGLCCGGDFFLCALILFVKLLEWMSVRAAVQRGQAAVRQRKSNQQAHYVDSELQLMHQISWKNAFKTERRLADVRREECARLQRCKA